MPLSFQSGVNRAKGVSDVWILGAGGGPVTLRSISGRRPAHSATDELLKLGIELAGIGIFQTDLQRKCTRYSPELCEMLRLPAGTELPYEDTWRFVHADDQQTMRAD